MTDEIQKLESEIVEHQDLYYNGKPVISDEEYDGMWNKLKRLNPSSKLFTLVGTTKAKGKVAHKCPMGSQNKVTGLEELEAWWIEHAGPKVLQHKLDGSSIELQYVDGKLYKAVTRGDGEKGDDVTPNIRKAKNVPLTVPFNGSFSVRGEVLVLKEDFEKLNGAMKNRRNAATGIMKRSDTTNSELLSVICYDVTFEREDLTNAVKYEMEKIAWLSSAMFETVPSIPCDTLPDITKLYTTLGDNRGQFTYDIDGIVIKDTKVDLIDSALPYPNKQVALKFSSEEVATKLTGVEWSQSGKRVTPVALVSPVTIVGVTVSRASLHSMNQWYELALAEGDTVLISRRGDVIPHVEKVLTKGDVSKVYTPPLICSCCGESLKENGAFLECSNPLCALVAEHQIAKWLDTLEIKGIGPAIIKELVSKGFDTIPKLYTIERGNTRSSQNVYDAIHSKREISLPKFIAGFDIDGVGETTVTALVNAGFDSIYRFLAAFASEFESVAGIGQITAEALVQGLSDNAIYMLDLIEHKNVILLASVTQGALKGETIVFTGVLNTMSRLEAENLARGAGATVKDSLVKSTTLLVTNDTSSGSAKNKKAQEQGVAIINEEDFLARCKG